MLKRMAQRIHEAAAARMTRVAMQHQTARCARRMRRSTQAQTMIEYALLAGFVAVVGAVTLATAPTTSDNLKAIINKAISVLALAAGAAAQSAC